MTAKYLLIYYFFFFGISGGMGTLSISIYYEVECDHVFDLTKHMSAEGAYNMSGQHFSSLWTICHLLFPLALELAVYQWDCTTIGWQMGVTEDKPPATLG